MRILCEAQAVDMHLFLFAASEKSSRAFSKFEIVRMEPSTTGRLACEKCGAAQWRATAQARVHSMVDLGWGNSAHTSSAQVYNWRAEFEEQARCHDMGSGAHLRS